MSTDRPIDDLQYQIGLEALLNEDLSSYEYYTALPRDVQRKLEARDVSSFADMQAYVEKLKDETIE